MKKMTKRRKNWLLVIVSITSIYLIISLPYERPHPQFNNGLEDTLPQWILTNAIVENFDRDGILISRLHADTAEFFPINDALNITKPALQYYQTKQLSWQVQANYGLATNDMTTLVLSDNVVVNNRQNTQTITTEWLSGDFDKNLLKTDKAVTITSPNTVATAVGLVSNWHNKTLKLLDDVHVQITPQR